MAATRGDLVGLIAYELRAGIGGGALQHSVRKSLDHLNPERHPAIEVAKDCAAGAVLVLSLNSLCVFIVFLLETWPT